MGLAAMRRDVQLELHGVLAADHLLDVGLDLAELGGEPLPVLRTFANLQPVTSSATPPSYAGLPEGPPASSLRRFILREQRCREDVRTRKL